MNVDPIPTADVVEACRLIATALADPGRELPEGQDADLETDCLLYARDALNHWAVRHGF